jgi:hypothetical protein
MPRLVHEVKLLSPLSRSIRSIERRLFTKIITQIDYQAPFSSQNFHHLPVTLNLQTLIKSIKHKLRTKLIS